MPFHPLPKKKINKKWPVSVQIVSLLLQSGYITGIPVPYSRKNDLQPGGPGFVAQLAKYSALFQLEKYVYVYLTPILH